MKLKFLVKQACFVSIALGACASVLQARPIRIDQEDFNFPYGGQAWNTHSFQTEGAALHSLSFALNIGGTSYSQLCVSERGAVWFGSSSCENPGSIGDLAGTPFVSPLFDPSLTLDGSLDSSALFNAPNSVSITSGRLNPFGAPYLVEGSNYFCQESFYEGGGSFDLAGCVAEEIANGSAQRAFRVNWSFDVNGTEGLEIFQLVFIDASGDGGPGDFDLEMNYQGIFTDLHVPQMALGGTPLTFAISDPDNPVFEFRNGVLVTDEPTPVPEPGTWALFAAGLAGIFALGYSRRRRES